MTLRVLAIMLPGVLVTFAATTAGAQLRAYDLPTLQDSALATLPRARQLDLLAWQSRLRTRNIAGELLPVIGLESQAQYQSDVASVPLPGAAKPPHDTYDARVGFNQRVLDPSQGPRRAVERAQLAQSQASLRATLYTSRQQVNDAFFAALRAQAQADELRVFIAAIETQARLAAARVREGAALPSEALVVRAELLRRRQALAEVRIQHVAALDVLANLTGVPLDSGTILREPDLAEATRAARAQLDAGTIRARPEYAQFERSRELLRAQERARAAQDHPRLTAFGRAGYGQPGLNPLNTTFDSYWLAGMQLQWAFWSWGSTRRDREILAVQREIVATEEAAFTDALRRAATQELAAIERLEAALAMDEEIIAVREQIARESMTRFAEAVITPADHVGAETDLLSARVTRAIHRVELAQARARFLTTLGIEVR